MLSSWRRILGISNAVINGSHKEVAISPNWTSRGRVQSDVSFPKPAAWTQADEAVEQELALQADIII